MTLWKLIKEKLVTDAFTGKGAATYGGRWNHDGIPVVYVGETLSLAALEVFVHLGHEGSRIRFSAIPVDIPDSPTFAIDDVRIISTLPDNWRDSPAPLSTKDIGTQWARSMHSAILRVPSTLIPTENNYILNPLHPDFKFLMFGSPQLFMFDSRMWKSSSTSED